jgi:hypothetical protein
LCPKLQEYCAFPSPLALSQSTILSFGSQGFVALCYYYMLHFQACQEKKQKKVKKKKKNKMGLF